MNTSLTHLVNTVLKEIIIKSWHLRCKDCVPASYLHKKLKLSLCMTLDSASVFWAVSVASSSKRTWRFKSNKWSSAGYHIQSQGSLKLNKQISQKLIHTQDKRRQMTQQTLRDKLWRYKNSWHEWNMKVSPTLPWPLQTWKRIISVNDLPTDFARNPSLIAKTRNLVEVNHLFFMKHTEVFLCSFCESNRDTNNSVLLNACWTKGPLSSSLTSCH